MKRHLVLAGIAITTLPSLALATNGYQLIGVGSYQKGLAGAVTAAPGSAMTAVTNPAGAARIGNRADFSMEAFNPDRSVDLTALGGRKEDSAVDMYGVPALGWAAPIRDDSNVYFGGGMYGTSGMGADYAVIPFGGTMEWDGYSNLAFWQMAPVVAWNVDEKLSLGVSLNIDYQSVSLKQRVTNSGTVAQQVDLSRPASAFGLGLSFGVLYDLANSVTLGFAYKSKQDFAEMKYQLASGDVTLGGTAQAAGTYSLDMDFPQQAAVGIAWRAMPSLTVSADVKWINWSDTMDKLTIKGPGGLVIPMNSGWDDQTVFALGVNYDLNTAISLRAGYNYASSPIKAEDVSNNLVLPAIVESHYTVGGTWRINNHWEVAAHYMVVPENTLTAPASDPQMPGARISLAETSFGANIGYRF